MMSEREIEIVETPKGLRAMEGRRILGEWTDKSRGWQFTPETTVAQMDAVFRVLGKRREMRA